MPWAVAAAAAVSVAGSAITANSQSDAISKGQQQANARVQPWVTTGTGANTQQADLLGLNGQPAADTAVKSFQASPGYGYQVSEGLRAVDAGAASRGTLVSGSTLRAEQTLGSNLANQDFGNYMTRLNTLSTVGANAASGQASTDTSAAGAQAKITGAEGKGITDAISGAFGSNSMSSLFSSGSSGNIDQGSF
jgi:hypothetical protein